MLGVRQIAHVGTPVVGEIPGLLPQVRGHLHDLQQAQHELVRVLHVRHEAKGAQHALLDAEHILLQVLEPLQDMRKTARQLQNSGVTCT